MRNDLIIDILKTWSPEIYENLEKHDLELENNRDLNEENADEIASNPN